MQRNRADRILALAANLRLAAIHAKHRAPVKVGEADDITRINQVRILDLRIGLPDLRPQPRLPEEAAGNVPQGVALFHHIGVRVIFAQLLGRHTGGEGQNGDGEN